VGCVDRVGGRLLDADSPEHVPPAARSRRALRRARSGPGLVARRVRLCRRPGCPPERTARPGEFGPGRTV